MRAGSEANLPVLVGVGQLVDRTKADDQRDPVEMMETASRAAAADAGLDGLTALDTLYIVNVMSRDLRETQVDLAARLGAVDGEVQHRLDEVRRIRFTSGSPSCRSSTSSTPSPTAVRNSSARSPPPVTLSHGESRRQ